jgi:hypothetical protein
MEGGSGRYLYSCESNNAPQAPIYSRSVRDFDENQSAFMLSSTNLLESLTMVGRGTNSIFAAAQ